MRVLGQGDGPTVPAADGESNSKAKEDRRFGMSAIKKGFRGCARWVRSVVRATRLRKRV